MKIHLFDGTYELFRSFYGAPSAKTSAGEEVGATRSLLLSLAAFVQRPEVTHVACAFDHVIESFRNELFDGYKTGEGIDPELWAQFPLVEAASRALGIVTWPMIEFEADDALATAAYRFRDHVDQVVLVSPDKDLMQCVRADQVVVFDRMRRRTYDHQGVLEKFGVEPESIPDYLALVGDSADGIPGIPRWGAKSAAQVLSHYRHLESIPDDETLWPIKVRGAAALAKNLREQREDSLLYRNLATLRTDVPLGEPLDDLRWTGPSPGELRALCQRIEDDTALERLSGG